MTVNPSDFLKHKDSLDKLRDEKDTIGLAIIKNPFEKLTDYLHDTHCGCMKPHQDCDEDAGLWEEGTIDLLEQMTIILDGPETVPSLGKKSKSRKMQIED